MCFVPGVGSCMCLRDALPDLRPSTRPLSSLVFQVYTLDQPLTELYALQIFLGLVAGSLHGLT